MSYAPSDQQPSLFYLRESSRQSILTVFNWTEHATSHNLPLSSLGLSPSGAYTVTSILDANGSVAANAGSLELNLPAHSVRMLKIVDTQAPAVPPPISLACPSAGKSGESLSFSAQSIPANPVVSWRWNFGDGVESDDPRTTHTWTEPGDYKVQLTASSLDSLESKQSCAMHITGYLSTVFAPAQFQRYEPK